MLVLVPRPGDESLWCGGLIAEACRRGRPPFVMVLGDGTGLDPGADPDRAAASHGRETGDAVEHLGLDRERLLLAGIGDGFLPVGGALFDAAVRAVVAVMWRQDCNLVCAPPTAAPDPADRATAAIADEVARRSLVVRLACAAGDAPGARRLHPADTDAKGRALLAHRSRPGLVTPPDEVYARCDPPPMETTT